MVVVVAVEGMKCHYVTYKKKDGEIKRHNNNNNNNSSSQ